ncbi:transposase OrfAB, subunit A [Vibrio splendidus 12B01]|nr:transposase OrfAB, subunit A [Vibrio splendidus 12B01]OCH63240.1 transposase [Vibrio splendidus]
MAKRTRRIFSPEFKLQAPQLVDDQGYSMVEAAKVMNVSKSAMDKWVRHLKQERQGITPKAEPLTLKQILVVVPAPISGTKARGLAHTMRSLKDNKSAKWLSLQ